MRAPFVLLLSAAFVHSAVGQFGRHKWKPRLFDKQIAPTQTDDDKQEALREGLPRVVEVFHYDLEIRPYFPFPGLSDQTRQDLTYDGNVTIFFRITNKTDSIYLFSQNVHLLRKVDLMQGSKRMQLDAYKTDLNLTRVTITPLDWFKVGQNYSLHIQYSSPINAYGDAGLYYVRYGDDATNNPQYLISTFFEPLRFRKLCPGFDDPHFKADFQLTVVSPNNAKVYHNMKEKFKEVQETAETKRTTFVVTPKMSTYLLAFVIGNFAEYTTTTKRGIEVKSIAIPEMKEYLNDSAVVAANCVDAMEGLVNVNYPYKKLWNIETIQMGHSGAMENIALIVYVRFLAQLNIATPAPIRFTQSMIECHEISHQWFGDLVTADRWGQEFLHESFAAFFQNRAVQEFSPEVDYVESTRISDREEGLQAAQPGEHPVSYTLAEFDGVTYASGGAILRMLERTLGQTTFFSALQTYLNAHPFGNAVDTDLMDAFESTVNNQPICGSLSISQIMTDFLRQTQYPIVYVGFDVNGYSLIQTSPAGDSKRWNIPIFAFDLDRQQQHSNYPFFLQSDGSFCPNGISLDATDLLLFNHKGLTFARFRYSPAYWDRLLSTNLSTVDDQTLLGLLMDTINEEEDMNASFKQRRSIRLIRKIIADKKGKVDAYILTAAIDLFTRFEGLFVATNERDLYAHLFQKEFGSVYSTVDWTSSNWADGHKNFVLLPYAVRYDVGTARADALSHFQSFLTGCSGVSPVYETCNPIPADARYAAYCEAARSNTPSGIQSLLNYWQGLIRTSDTKFYFQYELAIVAQGLACATKEIALDAVLSVAISNNRVEFVDALANHPTASKVLRDYIQDNPTEFQANLPLLEHALESIISTMYTPEDSNEFIEFILAVGRNFRKKGKKMLNKAAKKLEAKSRRSAVERAELVRWLYDSEVPISKSVWPLPLPQPEMADGTLQYEIYFTPYYPVDGYYYTADQLYTFDGIVTITYNATATITSRTIILHSHRHVIKSVEVQGGNPPASIPVTFTRDFEYAVLTLQLGADLTPSEQVVIRIEYTGFIFNEYERNQQGTNVISQFNFYNNETTNVLMTQFSNGTYPRAFVPCFDEPKYKARWSLNVVHPATLTALSNGNILMVNKLGDLAITTFQETNLMSSYLLAVAIGKFQAISGTSSSGVEVKVWAGIGAEVYGNVALQAAINAIDYMEEFTGVGYFTFNSKLDLLSVPGYLGAMESWGFIIGDEDILHNPAVHSTTHKRRTYDTCAHETIHQWFGDLVTTSSWKTTFVSEAFANHFVADIFDQNIGYGEYFRFIVGERGLRYDERAFSVVIPSDILAPDFDPFSPAVYDKPDACLSMLTKVIGENAFRQGLQAYINNHQFSTADDEILWLEIQGFVPASTKDWDGNDLDVQSFVDPFFKQASYPILNVAKSGKTLVISQESYYPPAAMPPSSFEYDWNVPIWASAAARGLEQKWLANGTITTFDDPPNVLVNPGRFAYARVLYDNQSWADVQTAYSTGLLNETVRAQLLTDTFALVKRGDIAYTRLLDLLLRYATEDNEIPWIYAQEVFDFILRKLKNDSQQRQQFVNVIAKLIGSRGYLPKNIEWGARDGNLAIIHLQSRINRGNFVDQTISTFAALADRCFQSPYGLDVCFGIVPDARPPTVCAGLQEYPDYESQIGPILRYYGSWGEHAFADAYAEPFIEGIACMNGHLIQLKHVQAAIRGDYGPLGALVIKRVAELDQSNEIVYNAVIADPTAAVQSFDFGWIVTSIATDWATQQQLDKFNQIQWGGLTEGQKEAVRVAAALINANIEWRTKNLPEITVWLNQHS